MIQVGFLNLLPDPSPSLLLQRIWVVTLVVTTREEDIIKKGRISSKKLKVYAPERKLKRN